MEGVKSRKKITKACDNCKRRKLKCTGELPCLLCKQKVLDCEYIKIDKRTLKGQRKGVNNHLSESEFSMRLLGNSGKDDQSLTKQARNNSMPNENIFPIASPMSLYGENNRSGNMGYDGRSALIVSNSLNYDNQSNKTSSMDIPKNSSHMSQGDGYVPRNLEPLLSFPIQDEMSNLRPESPAFNKSNHSNSLDNNEDDDGLSNENGRNTRLLRDTGGNLRYIGESSPLSLLFECRNIFYETFGHTAFTDDPHRMNIVDEPGKLVSGIPVQLPPRKECDILIKIFEENINHTYYVFDMAYFKQIVVENIFESPIRASNHKLALLHLVLALGSLFAEISPDYYIKELCYSDSATYFESGFILIRNSMDNGRLWMTEAYFLIYFYYQSTSKRSTSWLMLNMAIKNAQALGLHRRYINETFKDKKYVRHRRRIWQSLYTCDRISSILLGRPLSIGDYDCDDFDSTMPRGHITTEDDFTALCQTEAARIARINGKILKNFYGDGTINTNRAKRLAVELRKWSMDLRSEVQIDKLLTLDDKLHQEMYYSLLSVHMSQLYGIVLLSRPFFMYFSFQKADDSKVLKDELLLTNFRNACIKASILTIKFIDFFMKKCPKRVELFTIINCCFNSALILGLQIMYEKQAETQGKNIEYKVLLLMKTLDTARNILSNYGAMSATSRRFSDIIKNIQDSLRDKFTMAPNNGVTNIQPEAQSETPGFTGTGNGFEGNNFANINNTPRFNAAPELDGLLDFQQFFLPPDTTSPANTDASDKHDALELFMHNLGRSDILFDNGF